jgi:transposase
MAWSEPLPVRRGRPAGVPDRRSLAAASRQVTWRPNGSSGSRPGRDTKGAQQRAEREAVRQRTATMFAQGQPASSVARQLGVARQTAVRWQASWRAGGTAPLRSRGPSRRPKVTDSQLQAIEQALLRGAAAYGFDPDVWTIRRIGVVIQQLTGVQLAHRAVVRLLHERLGWSAQPAPRPAAVGGGTQEATSRDELGNEVACQASSQGRPGLP